MRLGWYSQRVLFLLLPAIIRLDVIDNKWWKLENASANLRTERQQKQRSDYTAIGLQDISCGDIRNQTRIRIPLSKGRNSSLANSSAGVYAHAHAGELHDFREIKFRPTIEAHSILVELPRSILRSTRARARLRTLRICTLFICILWYARGTRKFPGTIDSAYKVEVICMEIYVPRLPILWFRSARDLTQGTREMGV